MRTIFLKTRSDSHNSLFTSSMDMVHFWLDFSSSTIIDNQQSNGIWLTK